MKKKSAVKLLSFEIGVFAALLVLYVSLRAGGGLPEIFGFSANRNETPANGVYDNGRSGSYPNAPESNNAPSDAAADAPESNGITGDSGDDNGTGTQKPSSGVILNMTELPTPPAEKQTNPVTITFAGDVLIDRGVKTLMNQGGSEAILPAAHRYPFNEADIAMLNLEYPISTRGTPMEKEFTFRGDPEHIGFFNELGVDIVSLANNHTFDYGKDAFLDTLDLLDANNIKYVGAGRNIDDAKRYEIFEVSGKKIAILAASRVVPTSDWYAAAERPGVFGTYDTTVPNEQIRAASEEADYVIIYVHWGVELNTRPENYQINMAHEYIDNGADAVIGSHPHVLQGIEFYNGKPIIYSLGNFIFTNPARDSMAVTLTFNEDAPPEVKIIPYKIVNQKTFLAEDDETKQRIKEHIESISFDVTIDDEFVVRPE